MYSTDFGLFDSEEIYLAWREKMCVEENDTWRRKTNEELEQIDICSEPTTEEKLANLTEQVELMDETIAELILSM